ncbi:MAG TPA: FeoA family protein [Aggregatilineales bacterium]|nr:FeoA family protein [Aggregatilineales bacterium]
MVTLDQLNPGQSAIIRKVSAEKILRRRLLDMGLTRGIKVELLKAAPMGDPLEYRIRDYHLSLRKSEARNIEVEF